MKRKAMIMAVASLGSMALIGTGFAGWVISANATTSAEGVITAYDVKDQRLEIVAGTGFAHKVESTENGAIVFGKPTASTENKESDWFRFDDDVKGEVLSNTFNFKVKAKDDKDTNKNVAFTVTSEIKLAEGFETKWSTAKTAGIVGEFSSKNKEVSYTLNGTTAVDVNIDLTFAWGSHFTEGSAVVNPYTFYNGHKYSDTMPESTKTYGDDAAEIMPKFEEIKNVGFTLTITVARAK